MKRRTVSGRHHEDDVPQGFWPRVQARIGPLTTAEAPASTDTPDDRIVEFFVRERTQVWLDWPESEAYAPLRETGLLGSFLSLFGRDEAPPDPEVIGFYAKYGPLGEWVDCNGVRTPAWALRLRAEDQRNLRVEARLMLCEPVWWLRERARELRLTYDIYAALAERRADLLRSIVGELPQGKEIRLEITAGRVVPIVSDLPDLLTPPSPGPSMPRSRRSRAASRAARRAQVDQHYIRLCTGLLARQLNSAEDRSTRRWANSNTVAVDLDKDKPLGKRAPVSPDLTRVRIVDSLTAAMYLQLGELVAQQMALRHCPGCGRLFYPRRATQAYCDSRCGDAARQRAYYSRRRCSGTRRRATP
jgi:hypothetical protein